MPTTNSENPYDPPQHGGAPEDRSAAAAAPTGSEDRAFFGHPAGLLTLFFAEMWERFSYYGMRAILILFMTKATAEGGLGFDNAQKGVVYALYTSMVYFAGLAGGWLADNVLGQRRAVFWGGVVIMLGHISLAFHGLPFFFGGLGMIIVGTGLLKPNISTIVGQLYGPTDVRRDSGFAIYYMGINIGSFVGQTVCGFFAQHPWFKANVLSPMGISDSASWHWGFAAAAVGMLLGLIVFVWKGRLMGDAGLRPNPPANAAEALRRQKILWLLIGGTAAAVVLGGLVYALEIPVKAGWINIGFGLLLLGLTLGSFGRIMLSPEFSHEERRRLTVVCILFVASVVFWGAFEQAGGALNLFAENKSADKILGFAFPSSWYQNINPFGIMVLSPFFAVMWMRLGNRAPSSPAKFALALMLVGAGFVVAAIGSGLFDRSQDRISPMWLTVVYLLHTVGELCLSPIGLSMVTKLSPQRAVSQVMSIWFLANADANFLAGQTVILNEYFSDTQIFWAIAAITLLSGAVLAAMVKPIRAMMGGVH
jgi:POT family proton-dependent oligopeptide transporter